MQACPFCPAGGLPFHNSCCISRVKLFANRMKNNFINMLNQIVNRFVDLLFSYTFGGIILPAFLLL